MTARSIKFRFRLEASQTGIEADTSVAGLLDDGTPSLPRRSDKALCLYSFEVIEAWPADGHSIVPGAAGENVTVRGVDWTRGVTRHEVADRRRGGDRSHPLHDALQEELALVRRWRLFEDEPADPPGAVPGLCPGPDRGCHQAGVISSRRRADPAAQERQHPIPDHV